MGNAEVQPGCLAVRRRSRGGMQQSLRAVSCFSPTLLAMVKAFNFITQPSRSVHLIVGFGIDMVLARARTHPIKDSRPEVNARSFSTCRSGLLQLKRDAIQHSVADPQELQRSVLAKRWTGIGELVVLAV